MVIGILCAMSAWALMPKEGPDGERIPALNLGLDLQGGMHLAVEIDDPDGTLTAEARADAIDRTLTTIRNRIDEFGVREPTVQKVGNDRIVVELAGIDDPVRAKAIVERTAFLEFQIVRDGNQFRSALPRIDRAIVGEIGAENLRGAEVAPQPTGGLAEILGGQAVDTVSADSASADSAAQNGVPPDSAGASADSAAQTGDSVDDATANGPQFQGAQTLRPLTGLLLESGSGGIFLVAEEDVPTVERYIALEGVQRLLPRGSELLWGSTPVGQGGGAYRELYLLNVDPLITGDFLADAGPATRDPQFNQPIVPFEMTRRGARIFERGTSRNVGNLMGIVLDNRVQSAPVIRQTLSRRAQIELGAGADFQEAQDLALVLRAGALPQPIHVVEESTVGPSLGADSIKAGKLAFSIGVLAVVLVMIGYYRVVGVMAVAALLVYVLLVLGGLAGLGATLTFPGIAGLILSVGMAVDAYVLIFVRFRE